jgi:hypothetical protein
VVGYALYCGTATGEYAERLDVQNTLTCTISNLNPGSTYYFVVTAYTAGQVESLPSNEVAYAVPGQLQISISPDNSTATLRFAVNPNWLWQLQASDNLVTWNTIFLTYPVVNTWVEVLDPMPTNRLCFFYRVAATPIPP